MEPHRRTLSLLVLVRELLLALTEGGARDADEVDTAETVTRHLARHEHAHRAAEAGQVDAVRLLCGPSPERAPTQIREARALQLHL